MRSRDPHGAKYTENSSPNELPYPDGPVWCCSLASLNVTERDLQGTGMERGERIMCLSSLFGEMKDRADDEGGEGDHRVEDRICVFCVDVETCNEGEQIMKIPRFVLGWGNLMIPKVG